MRIPQILKISKPSMPSSACSGLDIPEVKKLEVSCEDGSAIVTSCLSA